MALEEREIGTVKWFNNAKGYGFIFREQGGEIFVHYSAINGSGYRSLKEGQRVEYTVLRGDKGLQAQGVEELPEGVVANTNGAEL